MSTTINSYSVSLALDAGSYIRNSALSRKETTSLIREINQARSPADNYERSLNRIDKALKVGAIDQGTYNRLLDSAKHRLNGASNAANQLSANLGRSVAALVGLSALKATAGDIARLTMEAESASISFEVLTGTAEEASELIAGLKSLAATTPLQLGDTQAAARTLLSFNVSAAQIIPTLKMLGDVTGGNSERFKMMSLAFAQMSSAGRLMGQDLLQMINAGFNPLQEISRKTGESMLELKKRMEEGGISSQEVAEAFKSATAEGGRFFGMTDKLAETLEGRVGILTDKVDNLKRAFGELLQTDFISAQLEGMTSIVEKLTQGINALTSGDITPGGFSRTELEGAKQNEDDLAFMRSQLALRRSGQPTVVTDSSRIATQASQAASRAEERKQIADGISSGLSNLAGGVGGSITSASTALLGSLQSNVMGVVESIKQSTVMLADTNTQLVKSVAEPPAIRSLQVGTQEAFDYLSQSTRDAEQRQRQAEAEKKRRDEKAEKNREQMIKWLERVNDTLEQNGFKRFR